MRRSRQLNQWASGVIALTFAGLLLLAWRRSTPQVADEAPEASNATNRAATAVEPGKDTGVAETNSVFRVTPGQALASVNGRVITLADLVPLPDAHTNAVQEMSREVYDYFLQRAINRELILQTARAQGLELSTAQRQQLANLRRLREQPEPGQVRRLNVSAGQVEFEVRDAEAFMLQTTLLSRQGTSPNVTSEQVGAYYQGHAAEFRELPNEEPARTVAWEEIDFEIRKRQAASVRSEFNTRLVAYMSGLRADSHITVSPLPEGGTAP